MPEPRLIFLNRFYAPEEPATAQLLTDLAEALAKRGRDVVVITSQPRNGALPPHETRRGVRVRRARSTKLGNRHALLQACDFLSFALLALWRTAMEVRRGDTLIVMTDPPLLGIPATAIARLRGARVIHWVQDTYPEVGELLTGKRFLGWVRPLRDRAWRSADACVLLGSDMATVARSAGVAESRIHLVPNWAPAGIVVLSDSEAIRFRREWGLEGRFVIAYFGNLGRVHDLEPILDVAERLRDEPAFLFVFIGPGAQRKTLERQAAERRLPNIRFFPAQPRERRSEALALGDIHLVTLREGGERVVFPSKLYAICAGGRPTLFIGPPRSEIAELIRARSLGRAFTRIEIDAIAAALRELRANPSLAGSFAAAGRAFHENEASLTHAIDRWMRVLAAVESSRPGNA